MIAQNVAVALRGRQSDTLQAAEQLHAMLELQSAERVLPLGVTELDAVLPRGGLVRGSVIELQVQGAGSAATSFALCACRAAQTADEQPAAGSQMAGWQVAGIQMAGIQMAGWQMASKQGARVSGAQQPWCAFIDASASLFAPSVARMGVELERLLVVRPEVDAIERVAIRIAEAKAISLLVIDLRGALAGLPVESQRWPRTVRRLALAVRSLGTCVLIITSSEPRSVLPLPVATRLEFSRARAESFEIRVAKERSGRVSTPNEISWSVFDAPLPEQPLPEQPLLEDGVRTLRSPHSLRRSAAVQHSLGSSSMQGRAAIG